jgi:hypothetical protein
VEKGEAKEAIRIEEGCNSLDIHIIISFTTNPRIGQKPNLLIRDRVRSSYEHKSEAKKVN